MTKRPESTPQVDASAGGQTAAATSSSPAASGAPSSPIHFQFALPNIGAPPATFPAGTQLMVHQQVQSWQSPYPPPEHIREYESVLPGAFDRILGMTEAAQTAQIESVRTAQANIRADAQRGNYLGFAVTLIAMACSMACVIRGAMWIAAAFLSVPVMSVAKVLIESAKSRHAAPAAEEADTPPTQQR